MKKLLISLFAIMAMVSCTEDGVTDNGGGNNNQGVNTIEASTIYVEVSCSESSLLNHIYEEFDSNVTSIQKKDNGYLITLKEGFEEIPKHTFYDCSWLNSIIIGYGIKSIGNSAFNGSGLRNVAIPDSVISIGSGAFSNSSLTSITIPGSVISIGNYTFLGCHSLESVKINSGVTSIVEGMFGSCDSLESITIPNSVTSIESYAFYGCESLHSITIPESVTSIEEYVFPGCKSLTAFYGKYASSDNRCLIVDGVLNSFAPSGLTEYTIPNSVTSIGNRAFAGCKTIKNVFIPYGVTSIGNKAFRGCETLVGIHISDSVTTIGEMAFDYCIALTDVTIGNSVKMIGAFAFDACKSLSEAYCKPITPPSLGQDPFGFPSPTVSKIYVPAGSINAYKTASDWRYLKNKIIGYNFE